MKTNPFDMAEVPEPVTRIALPEVTPAPGATSKPKPVVMPVAERVMTVPVKLAVLLVKLAKVPAVEVVAKRLSKPPVPV